MNEVSKHSANFHSTELRNDRTRACQNQCSLDHYFFHWKKILQCIIITSFKEKINASHEYTPTYPYKHHSQNYLLSSSSNFSICFLVELSCPFWKFTCDSLTWRSWEVSCLAFSRFSHTPFKLWFSLLRVVASVFSFSALWGLFKRKEFSYL